MDTGNDHVFGYFCHHGEQSVLILANFTESEQHISGKHLRHFGWDKTSADLLGGKTITATQQLIMEPYQLMILGEDRLSQQSLVV